MSEQLPRPETNLDENLKQKIIAGGAAVALVAGMPMVKSVEHSTQSITTDVSQDQVSSQAIEVLPANPTELKIEVNTDQVSNEHREDFQTTPEDETSTSSQVSEAVSGLTSEQLDNLASIQVTGLASAEDEAANQGLQTPSEQNQQLAQQRADIAEGAVVSAFDQRGKSVEDIMTVQAEEHQWSDEQLAAAEQLATEAGFANAGAMVEAYNDDPDSATDQVKDFLSPLLDVNRGATVTMNFESPVAQDAPASAEAGPEVVPNEESEVETITTESTEVISPSRDKAVMAQALEAKRRQNGGTQFDRRDGFKDDIAPRQNNGQKPIRHRGRTHMTNRNQF